VQLPHCRPYSSNHAAGGLEANSTPALYKARCSGRVTRGEVASTNQCYRTAAATLAGVVRPYAASSSSGRASLGAAVEARVLGALGLASRPAGDFRRPPGLNLRGAGFASGWAVRAGAIAPRSCCIARRLPA
jgi:hypothetical protein